MHCNPGYKCCDQYDGETVLIKCKEGNKHYGKLCCIHCLHFVKFAPNPNITKRCEERDKEINKYIASDLIEDKYKKVLKTFIGIRFLTPKQNNFYEYIKSMASIGN